MNNFLLEAGLFAENFIRQGTSTRNLHAILGSGDAVHTPFVPVKRGAGCGQDQVAKIK
jgi:hypothetical protein